MESRRFFFRGSSDVWRDVLGCPGQEVRIHGDRIMGGLFHLLIHGLYWGYNLLTNLLLTSWDIQVLLEV